MQLRIGQRKEAGVLDSVVKNVHYPNVDIRSFEEFTNMDFEEKGLGWRYAFRISKHMIGISLKH